MARRVGKQGPGEGEWHRFRTEAKSYFRRKTTTVFETVEVPALPPRPAPLPTSVTRPPATPAPPQPAQPPKLERPTPPPAPAVGRWVRPAAYSTPAVGLWLLSAGWDPALALIFTVSGVIGLAVLAFVLFVVAKDTAVWVSSRAEYRRQLAAYDDQNSLPTAVSPPVPAPVPEPVPEPVATPVPEPVPAPVPQLRRIRKTVPVDAAAEVEKAEAAARRGGGPAVSEAFPDMPQSITRLATGAESEESVGLMLERKLGDEWSVAHNLAVKKGRRTSANIDHLLSGPPGLVMVDTKGWSGELYLSGRTLTCDSSFSGSQKARAKAPSTCLYEASAVSPKVKLIVLAVTRGTVRGGRINVPRPRSAGEEGLPDIPVVAMDASKVPAFLEGMGGSESLDLEQVVARSKRLAWDD